MPRTMGLHMWCLTIRTVSVRESIIVAHSRTDATAVYASCSALLLLMQHSRRGDVLGLTWLGLGRRSRQAFAGRLRRGRDVSHPCAAD